MENCILRKQTSLNISMSKINTRSSLISLLIILVGAISIVTSLGGLSDYSSLINRVLMGLYLITAFWLIISSNNAKHILLLVVLLILVFIDLAITGFQVHQLNDIFYLPLWVLNLLAIAPRYNCFKEELIRKHKFIFHLSVIWNAITFVSLAFPTISFTQNSYDLAFWGFCGQMHRFAGTALFAIFGSILEYIITKRKRKLLFSIFPIIAILLCDARTYIIIASVLVLFTVLLLIKNKYLRRLVLLFSLIGIIFIGLYYTSMRASSNIFVLENYGSLHFITSGRSTFWKIDIEEFFKTPFWNIIFGDGYNFVYNVNEELYGSPIWAHNDYINILLANGIIGLFIYFYAIYLLIKTVSRKVKFNKLYLMMFLFILFFNAFFNMLYTYVISNLLTPLLAILMLDLASNKK